MSHLSNLVILIVIRTIICQYVQIHDITNNAGALILQRGEGRIIAGYDRLLHIIELPQFEMSISILENVSQQLKNSSSELSEILQTKLREIRFTFNTININSFRSKRAIETLGSVIKFVSGNLDAEDLRIINSDLDSLRKSQAGLIKQNNRQIKINSKFENRINLVNNDIKIQQNLLRNFLQTSDNVITENQRIALIFKTDILLDSLKSIEYAIMLAKLNIISRQILSTKEIKTIVNELNNQGVEIHHLDNIDDILTTTVIYKGSTLIISVNIPRLLPTKYQEFVIEPLPISNRTFKINHRTVFANSEQTLATISPCRGNDKVQICERTQIIDISNNQCESSIVRAQHGACDMTEKAATTEVRQITPGTLLVIANNRNVTLNSTCGIYDKVLTGIHTILFHNCSVRIKNELYENYEIEFRQKTILPIQAEKISPVYVEPHTNYSEIKELHLKNRRHLESLESKQTVQNASLSFFAIVMILLVGFGLKKFKEKLAKFQIATDAEMPQPRRLGLTEGAVTEGTGPSRIVL
ncbi:uncharacterized protein LOC129738937 [Uranotaenia lowii]|uniref:uncharacterized protein LOC129738937 n=1 Tax=Uranotaenia lowii TaxID=190385 RepID=UPI00247AFCF7|nr:uncharacterized protein LOC129738937 [Uranotaenia lowii]